ncbi:MAG: sigma-54 dependent transcriptional regulator [Desulfovibrio sp.]|jgi:DNA-binding NtrC family response regulator|nr:sigma-54 dependent transcriptional regulator [Desulfovibrio sp.]
MSMQRILFLAPAQTVTRIFPQLRESGVEVGIAENLKGASSFMRKGLPALILSRPFLPGFRIEDLLAVGKDDPDFPPVVVFSDRPSPEEAARLMECGAADYWSEPLVYEKIRAVLPTRSQTQPLPSSTLGGRKAEPEKGRQRIVGTHPAVLRVLALAKQVAKSRATVLISGESGTGKEMFARYLHTESDRAERAFVAVNCAALPEHLLESELFGHEKGAFTGAIARKLGKFELASGGTILLDEISEMDPALQAKLLRVLQESEIDRVGGTETLKVDVRVIATTNRDLESWVREGRFRQDLFFRLNVIPLRLPALRERGEDALLLARFFVDMYVREYALPAVGLSPEATAWIADYSWPGNVRELQNLMERAVLLSAGQDIRPGHFLLGDEEWPIFEGDPGFEPDQDEAGDVSGANGWTDGAQSDNKACRPPEEDKIANSGAGDRVFAGGVIPLYEMERIMIRKGLEQTGGNRTQAAELLGISVRTLRNKLNEYREAGLGLDMPEK